MLSRTAIVANSAILRRHLPEIYRKFFDMLTAQAQLPALPFAVTAEQRNESAELISQLKSHKRHGIPISTNAFLDRLIKALKAKQ